MLKKIALAAALLSAGVMPALAQASCTAPAIPAAVDGNSATRDQMLAGMAAANAYMAASDAYQNCLNDDLKTQKAAATADKKPFDPAIEQAILAKGAANQIDKQKVGDLINGAVGVYKKLHPTG